LPDFKVPAFFSEGTKESYEKSQDSRSSGRGFKPGFPEYEARVSAT